MILRPTPRSTKLQKSGALDLVSTLVLDLGGSSPSSAAVRPCFSSGTLIPEYQSCASLAARFACLHEKRQPVTKSTKPARCDARVEARRRCQVGGSRRAFTHEHGSRGALLRGWSCGVRASAVCL